MNLKKIKRDKIIDHFKNKGWVKINNFIPKEDLIKVNEKIQFFLKKNFDRYSKKHINFASNEKLFSKINSFHKLNDCKEISKFSKRKSIENIAKSLLLVNKIKLRQSEYFAKPKKIGLPVPDHQDNYFWNIIGGNALTIWIALSPSNKKNGAIHYYEASHLYNTLKHVPSFAKGTSQKIKNIKFLKRFKKVIPELNRGDALIHHASIVHGSKRNSSSITRKGITFQFIDKTFKLDTVAKKRYEKQLQEQILTRN